MRLLAAAVAVVSAVSGCLDVLDRSCNGYQVEGRLLDDEAADRPRHTPMALGNEEEGELRRVTSWLDQLHSTELRDLGCIPYREGERVRNALEQRWNETHGVLRYPNGGPEGVWNLRYQSNDHELMIQVVTA